MTDAWTPLLEDLPALAGPLLGALRRLLPALFEAAAHSPESAAGPFSTALEVAGDPEARLTVAGGPPRRGRHGRRASLSLELRGEIRSGGRRAGRLAGEVVLDLATKAILSLRLDDPIDL